MSKRFRNNPVMNNAVMLERFYESMIQGWAATRVKWYGVPLEIDTRYLEMTLHRFGRILFYHDNNALRYMAVRMTAQGAKNVYDNPTTFRTQAMGSYKSVLLTSKEAVPIWHSYQRDTYNDMVKIYAKRLSALDISLEINTKGMRKNRIVVANENQRLSYENLMRQVEEGQSVIFGYDGLVPDAITVLDLAIPAQAVDTLRLEKNQVWNECMTMLGIQSANQDKKERLVADEVGANNGQMIAARKALLKPRREAVDRINQMFGLSISVEWDDDARDVTELVRGL